MASPLIWGTDLWKTCHRFSLAYPDKPTPKHKSAARAFFGSLATLLPCAGCRRHYEQYYKRHFSSASIESRDRLVRWVYDLHEEVNRRLGKPIGVVKIDDLQRLYNAFPRRYISADGKQLLRTPRYSTVGDDIGFEDKFLSATTKDGATTTEEGGEDTKEKEEQQQGSANTITTSAAALPTARNNTGGSILLSHSLRNQLEAAEHASAHDVLADVDSSVGAVSTTMWIVIGVISAIALLLIIAIITCVVLLMQQQRREKEDEQTYIVSRSSSRSAGSSSDITMR